MGYQEVGYQIAVVLLVIDNCFTCSFVERRVPKRNATTNEKNTGKKRTTPEKYLEREETKQATKTEVREKDERRLNPYVAIESPRPKARHPCQKQKRASEFRKEISKKKSEKKFQTFEKKFVKCP